ncbi:cache domain-containing protein [bacterium]|nr:cache domain-containing protein [bacterium]
MNIQNEKQVLFIIRYSLILVIFFLSIVITTFFYFEKKYDLEIFKENIEDKYINSKKRLIKEQVDNLYNYIISEQEDTEEALKQSLISRVNEAHKIITNIYNEHKNFHNKKELSELINVTIKSIRFNNRGYFFIYDKEATNIVHPLLPHLEGKSLIDYKDTKGTYVLRESLSLLKNQDESYQEWYWRKDKNDETEYKKIGFVKNIYELDWFIGTGEYVEDFSQDIQKKVLVQINKLKFGQNGYFIVTDKNNNYISHINKDLIGKNAFEKIQTTSDRNNLAQIQKVMEEKKGYVYLDFYKPNSDILSSKIIYLRNIPNWNWTISTGFYKDDVDVLINEEKKKLDNKYNDRIRSLFIFSISATLILFILSSYISYIIEQKLKKYKLDIEHHITQNQKQYELLSQKSKLSAMGEMIQNIAHQWRQPLSLITTYSSSIKLKKQMNTLDDDFLYDSLDNIGYTANHLSETIEDFRDFFRPDKEKISFSMEIIIQKVLKLLYAQIKDSNIHIVKNIEEITINNYERELLQVLINIIKNAIDALHDFEGEKYIFIDIFRKEDKVYIEIKDNAGGIKEDIIERVFEPYFTTKHQSQGTGIGLYMSEEIITKHMDGELTVQNVDYEFEAKRLIGAMFIISLPINIEL